MFGVLTDALRSHFLPNSRVTGAPTQHCEVAALSNCIPASFDSLGRKRQAFEVGFSTQRRLGAVLAKAHNAETVLLEDDDDKDDSHVNIVDCVAA
jgi:hypothetical protein